ncbi:MAG: hypothetical protein GXO48_04145 [Chlorobi bacterium]|nr:hypothetical protein [Chlorobiota bacterium]
MASGKKLFEILMVLTNSERQLIKKKLSNLKELTQEEHFLLYMLKRFKPDMKTLQEIERQYAFQERLSVGRMRHVRSNATQLLLTMLVNLRSEDNVVIKNLLSIASAIELRLRKLYPRAIETYKKLLQDPILPFYSPELRLLAFSELQKISRVDIRFSTRVNERQLNTLRAYTDEVSHFIEYFDMLKRNSFLRELERKSFFPLRATDLPKEAVETYKILESTDIEKVASKPSFVFRRYALCSAILHNMCLHYNSAYLWLEQFIKTYNHSMKSAENRKLLAEQYAHDMLYLCATSVRLGHEKAPDNIAQLERELQRFEGIISPQRYLSYLTTLFLFKMILTFKKGEIEEVINLYETPPAPYKSIFANSNKLLLLHSAKLVYLMAIAIKGKTAIAIEQTKQIMNEFKNKNDEVILITLIIMVYASLKSGHSASQYINKLVSFIHDKYGELNILPVLQKLIISVSKRNYGDGRRLFNELEQTLEKYPLEYNVFRQVPFIQIIKSIVNHEDLQQVLQNTDFHKEALLLEDRCRRYLHKELKIPTS